MPASRDINSIFQNVGKSEYKSPMRLDALPSEHSKRRKQGTSESMIAHDTATTKKTAQCKDGPAIAKCVVINHPHDRGLSSSRNDPEPHTQMLRQPETRPISHEQLVVEVKDIYAWLVIVEAKCIAVDEKQAEVEKPRGSGKDLSQQKLLKHDQWQSLIGLHEQLLHEHHDIFLASQHSSASENSSKLAEKYSIPARMWRHGIHAFLEVLRHRLPETFEHMLAFIYIAYSMIALLHETVPTFEDTWIECLGDLGRYRMAIEDDEPKDRDVWSGVARYWYSQATTKVPNAGRLYHHLAILARPYTVEQLSFYTRSLTCIAPFESACGSVMTLLNPILSKATSPRFSSPSPLAEVCRDLSFLFEKRLRVVLDPSLAGPESLIDDSIFGDGFKFKCEATHLAVSNVAALFQFGHLSTNITDGLQVKVLKEKDVKDSSGSVLYDTYELPFLIRNAILDSISWSQEHEWSTVHVMCAFIWSIAIEYEVLGSWKYTEQLDGAHSDCEKPEVVKSPRNILQRDTCTSNYNTAICAVSQECACECDEQYTSAHFLETWHNNELRNGEALMDRHFQWICSSSLLMWMKHCYKRVKFLLSCPGSTKSSIQPWSSISSLAVLLLFTQAVVASSPSMTESIASNKHVSPEPDNLAANISALVLVVTVLGATQLLVMITRNPVPVYGTMMTTYSFGWWCIRNDTVTSSGFSWAVLFIWCVFSILYCKSTFELGRPPSYYPLVSLAFAIALDLVIVRYTIPSDRKLSQIDILNLSLPSMSLALIITAVDLVAYNRLLLRGDRVYWREPV